MPFQNSKEPYQHLTSRVNCEKGRFARFLGPIAKSNTVFINASVIVKSIKICVIGGVCVTIQFKSVSFGIWPVSRGHFTFIKGRPLSGTKVSCRLRSIVRLVLVLLSCSGKAVFWEPKMPGSFRRGPLFWEYSSTVLELGIPAYHSTKHHSTGSGSVLVFRTSGCNTVAVLRVLKSWRIYMGFSSNRVIKKY